MIVMIDPDLMKAAKFIVEDCLRVKPKEEFLVIIDSSYETEIAEAAMSAAHAVGAEAQMIVLPRWPYLKPPTRAVTKAMSAVDVLWAILPIHYTDAMKSAENAGIRIIYMPFLTKDMLIATSNSDLKEILNRSKSIANVIEKSKMMRITTEKGTDLTVPILEPNILYYPYPVSSPPNNVAGMWGCVSYIAPYSAEGVVIVDGSNQILGLLKESIRLRVKNGSVIAIDGGREAEEFEDYVKSFNDPNAYKLAHVSAGLNPKFKFIGNVLMDEHVLGAVTIGMGVNIYLGGKIKSKMHTDLVLRKATVMLDGRAVLKDGTYML